MKKRVANSPNSGENAYLVRRISRNSSWSVRHPSARREKASASIFLESLTIFWKSWNRGYHSTTNRLLSALFPLNRNEVWRRPGWILICRLSPGSTKKTSGPGLKAYDAACRTHFHGTLLLLKLPLTRVPRTTGISSANRFRPSRTTRCSDCRPSAQGGS